jgi:hypothetical protein
MLVIHMDQLSSDFLISLHHIFVVFLIFKFFNYFLYLLCLCVTIRLIQKWLDSIKSVGNYFFYLLRWSYIFLKLRSSGLGLNYNEIEDSIYILSSSISLECFILICSSWMDATSCMFLLVISHCMVNCSNSSLCNSS